VDEVEMILIGHRGPNIVPEQGLKPNPNWILMIALATSLSS
jgi:hypothetical protein